MGETHIWWIRRDIRLQDNQALTAAIRGADHLIPLFILEPDLMDRAAPLRRAFLLNALKDLDRQLQALGSGLIVRKGPALRALRQLTDKINDAKIFACRDYSPFACQRDEEIQEAFSLVLTSGITLREPDSVLKGNSAPYTIYTPYKNKFLLDPLPLPADCLPIPKTLPPLPEGLPSDELPAAVPVPGFAASATEAQRRLADFAGDGLLHYQTNRDRLDLDGTSCLSPYLRFGLISVRECFAGAHLALIKAPNPEEKGEIQTWINELVWREFFIMILARHPRVLDGPFREELAAIPWRNAPMDLQAWQQGQTGFPIIDACMRQMLNTGWMHNRGRMVVASFLTKDLLINWQEGETWFMAHLVDGDPAANNGGWQWTAGTGTDAAPYFRIFNPILQSKKFDPDGAFIAHWVPELANLPPKFRHEPWKMTPGEASRLNFKPGLDYPERIVDRSVARGRTLAAYQFTREQAFIKQK
ncbi:MAG: deoxyribodipyrimidine photo-lyase [Anaerolineaceae bacterium]|nr:deoxyribodipyrimidine photo-lyase [Anaerolineaceae bacterium]